VPCQEWVSIVPCFVERTESWSDMGRTVTFSGLTETAVRAITIVLKRRGYRVVRSFDLQSALNYHVEHCPCPHHGTEKCTCQYVVLLAYPAKAQGWVPPRVFTAHSYDNLTQVALQQDNTLDEEERFALVSAIVEAALLLSPDEPLVETQAGIPSPAES
jgi:hypothetical protein